MGNSLLQLIALAAIAVYLILRLRKTLGTRDGFEGPDTRAPSAGNPSSPDEGKTPVRVDRDIVKHVEEDSSAATALAAMKQVESGFSVSDFIEGACNAYEMILIAFVRGDMEEMEPFLSSDVYDSFEETISGRPSDGLRYEARFVGIRESTLKDARFDGASSEAEITIEFVGELVSYVTDSDDNVVEGDDSAIRRQRDVWTFARRMGANNPNWQLVATGD